MEAKKWSSCCQERPDPGGRNDVRSADLAMCRSLVLHFYIPNFTFQMSFLSLYDLYITFGDSVEAKVKM